ncbi:MAG: phosphatase PAP2-related protein [Patescibacteria group bacterium]
MKWLINGHRGFWTKENILSLVIGLAFLLASLIFQFSAAQRSNRIAASSNFVSDFFLDRLPLVNVDFIVLQGALILWFGVIVLLFLKPRHLLFGLKAIAIFVIVRAIFLNLTYIGLYPEQIVLNPDDWGYDVYSLFSLQGNYFFSGHTGLPFLLALIFYKNRTLRYFFYLTTVFFGASMLLAHVHYSIDVFAAPFMAYGIFALTRHLFRRDHAIMESDGPSAPLTAASGSV